MTAAVLRAMGTAVEWLVAGLVAMEPMAACGMLGYEASLGHASRVGAR